jgi:hypothetical protein
MPDLRKLRDVIKPSSTQNGDGQIPFHADKFDSDGIQLFRP